MSPPAMPGPALPAAAAHAAGTLGPVEAGGPQGGSAEVGVSDSLAEWSPSPDLFSEGNEPLPINSHFAPVTCGYARSPSDAVTRLHSF